MGGPDTPDNRWAVHEACHRAKTAVDKKMIFKAIRSAEKKARHDEAMATGQRAPNANERKLEKIRAYDSELRITKRQD